MLESYSLLNYFCYTLLDLSRNLAYGFPFRGFDSHPLRQDVRKTSALCGRFSFARQLMLFVHLLFKNIELTGRQSRLSVV